MHKVTYIKVGILISLVIFLASGCKNSAYSEISQPVNVVVREVRQANFKQDLTYSGTIEESETIPLNFSSIGTVSQVLVSEGDWVCKGTLLAKLDNTTYQHTYEMALAMQQRAEDAYKRLTPMHENNTIPEIKYVEITTRLREAKSATAMAKKNLDDCNLYATIDGFIGKRSIEPGMMTVPNMTPITLVKIDKVFARIPVPENEIATIRKGEKAFVSVRAVDAEYMGIVEEIGVVADVLSHTYKIKIAIANRDRNLKPGMVCSAVLHHQNNTRGLTVPNQAILIDEEGHPFVYTIDPHHQKAIRKTITVKNYMRDGVEVTSGLNKNELVVIQGQHKLVDQAKIKIVKEGIDQ